MGGKVVGCVRESFGGPTRPKTSVERTSAKEWESRKSSSNHARPVMEVLGMGPTRPRPRRRGALTEYAVAAVATHTYPAAARGPVQ